MECMVGNTRITVDTKLRRLAPWFDPIWKIREHSSQSFRRLVSSMRGRSLDRIAPDLIQLRLARLTHPGFAQPGSKKKTLHRLTVDSAAGS